MQEIHSLFDGIRREVPLPRELRKYFEKWKERSAYEEADFESFVAGWIMGSNPSLKKKILRLIYSEAEIGRTFGNDRIN